MNSNINNGLGVEFTANKYKIINKPHWHLSAHAQVKRKRLTVLHFTRNNLRKNRSIQSDDII